MKKKKLVFMLSEAINDRDIISVLQALKGLVNHLDRLPAEHLGNLGCLSIDELWVQLKARVWDHNFKVALQFAETIRYRQRGAQN